VVIEFRMYRESVCKLNGDPNMDITGVHYSKHAYLSLIAKLLTAIKRFCITSELNSFVVIFRQHLNQILMN